MKKKFVLSAITVVFVAALCLLTACGGGRVSTTVTYYSDGEVYRYQNVTGTVAAQWEAPVPERDNYRFDGWFLDEEYAEVFVMADYVRNEERQDISVYAKWTYIGEDPSDGDADGDTGGGEVVTSGFVYADYGDGYVITKVENENAREIELPSSHLGSPVTGIGAEAFADMTSLRRIVVPDSVRNIGPYAFAGCTALSEVDLTCGLEKISAYAFEGCTALAEITLPEGLTTLGAYAFEGCTALEEIVVPSTAEIVSGFAFSGCSGLTSATLLEGVKEIGNGAFYNCSALEEIALPYGLTSIGGYAFYKCGNVTSAVYGGSSAQWASVAKEEGWNRYALFSVLCTDGTV